MKSFTQIRFYLGSWIKDLRRDRDYGNVLEAETLATIAAEGAAAAHQCAALAHRARVADDEATRIIDQVLADGNVTVAELPLLRTARRHITQSARHDHNLAEALLP